MAGRLKTLLETCPDMQKSLSLHDYLREVAHFSDLSYQSIDLTDNTFLSFLSSTLVALKPEYQFPTRLIPGKTTEHCKLVDTLMLGLVASKVSQDALRLNEPVQTIGYSLMGQNSQLRKNVSLTLTLKTTNWEKLHEVVGSSLIQHLFSDPGIFLFQQVGNGYIQVSGPNIGAMLRKDLQPPKITTSKPTNYKEFEQMKQEYSHKMQDSKVKKFDVLCKLQAIQRVKMLYSTVVRHNNWVGRRNPLRLNDVNEAAKLTLEQILGSRAGEKYRVRLLPMVLKLTKNFKKVAIGAHLNRQCPLPGEWKETWTANLEQNFSYEWLFQQYSRQKQVTSFMINYLLAILPKDLLGSAFNKRKFCKSVKEFISMKVWDKVTVAALCGRYRFSEIKWLQDASGSHTEKRLVFGKVLHWVFNELVVPILQNSFYITEKQNETSLFYYRKPLWSLVIAKSTQVLEETHFFTKVTRSQADTCRDYSQFPPAKLRIQPKIDDFRPIMHFRTKIMVSEYLKLDGNSLLAGLPQILKACIEPQNPAAVLDFPSLIGKFDAFAEEVRSKGNPKLYFLTMDISKAFDSVNLAELREQLTKVPLPQLFAYYKYITLSPKYARYDGNPINKSLRFKYNKTAVDESQFPLFSDLIAQKNSESIHVLTSKTTIQTKSKLNQLDRLLRVNIIKLNRRLYQSQRGVPQGLSCSPLLAHLYYGRLETEVIAAIKAKYPSALLFVVRLHDDYMCLSDQQDALEAFIREMYSLGEVKGFSFKPEKVMGNFQSELVGKNCASASGWVGLDVSPDLQIVPHPSTELKFPALDFDKLCPSAKDVKAKLVKMINVTVNLFRTRTSMTCKRETLEEAFRAHIQVQAKRFVLLLKETSRVYDVKHSETFISRLIPKVLKHTGDILSNYTNCSDLTPSRVVKIGLEEFAAAFSRSSLHGASKRMTAYLVKLA